MRPARRGDAIAQLKALRRTLSDRDSHFSRRPNYLLFTSSLSSALEGRLAGLRPAGYDRDGRGLLLDYLVRGPWRDPKGFNFPKTANFDGWQVLPKWGEIHLGALFAVVAAVFLAIMMWRMLKGFELRVLGLAPRAGRFAGFSSERAVLFCFLLSGGLAGLAGASDVMGVSGQLQTPYSPNYGFVAIIVAFLGRLNPIGAIVAGLLLALSFIGGESAQVTLGISDKIAKVFQGILLFFILGCDTLILYRVRLLAGRAPQFQSAG